MSQKDNSPAVRVLAVDDREANLVAIRQVLRPLAVQVDTVTRGEEALTQLLTHDYAVVLLDVQMPGMSGFEVARLMHGASETEHIPIIFITAGAGSEQDMLEGYDAGAVDYLIKPYDKRLLVSKVRVFVQLYELQHNLQQTIERETLANEQLRDANQQLEAFTSIAAHDLRAPLRKCRMQLSRLAKRLALPADSDEGSTIAKATRNLADMEKLVEALLQLSDAGSSELHLEMTALSEPANAAADLLSEIVDEKSGSVQIEPLPEAPIDRVLMRQVFQNLIGNALKFAREGVPPHITVRAEAVKQAGQIGLCVQDNGRGFAHEQASRIFQCFSRLDGAQGTEGHGIGLHTVRTIVERHGGSIHADSTPGEGACFHIRLPATPR